MATETTFFSYSRHDSDFVLKLAKDLRNAGENVWLDQLDIQAGSHWDTSIEAALESATRLIVIISPESVASNNVMDEVSFALESSKTVIPVIKEECKTPFRLRRLQHIDFSCDYDEGLTKLLKAMDEPGDQPAVIPVKNSDREKVGKPDGEDYLSAFKKDKPSNSKFYWIVGGVIMIALVIWGVMSLNSGDTVTHVPVETTVAKVDTLLPKTISEGKGNTDDKTKPERDEIDNDKPSVKKTPFYAIMVEAVRTEREARMRASALQRKRIAADYLWIPDYASLSGAKMFSIYIGPFSTQRECEIATEKYRRLYPSAYGLLVSQEKKRVQINGLGKVKVTNN